VDADLRGLIRRAVDDASAARELPAAMARAGLRPAQQGRVWAEVRRCRWCYEPEHAQAFTGPACEGSGVVRQVFVRNEPLQNPEPGARFRYRAPHPETGELVDVRPVYRDVVTEQHALGTRGRICRTCSDHIYRPAPGRAYTSRWAVAAVAALDAARRTSACRAPEGIERAMRAAKPWQTYSTGNGMAWANQVWTRELKRALHQVGANVRAGRKPVDDGAPLFDRQEGERG